MKVEELFIGRRVKADHPITCMNPEKTFIVKFVKGERRWNKDTDEFEMQYFVRGEHTMWFHQGLVELSDETSQVHLPISKVRRKIR